MNNFGEYSNVVMNQLNRSRALNLTQLNQSINKNNQT